MSIYIKEPPSKFFTRDWQSLDLTLLSREQNSANWSSMGTFKTSTGLWLAERLRPHGKGNILIVTTKSGKGTYFDALPRCYDLDKYVVFNLSTKKVEEVVLGNLRFEYDLDDFITTLQLRKQPVVMLAHYHCFTNKSAMNEILVNGAETGKIQFDVVILDEAHKIKNKDTQWSRNLKKIAHASKQKDIHRHLMTGTGFVNNPAEAWSLFNFMEPDEFGSYWRFRREYCEEENYSGYETIVGIKEEKIEDFRNLRKKFGPRRTMQEVHKDIQEPIYSTIEVELGPEQRRMYKEIVKELMALDQDGFPLYAPNVVSLLQRLRQISVATPSVIDTFYDPKVERQVQIVELVEPSSKLDAVMEILEGLQWDDEMRQQIVVFSNFKDPLELLKNRLREQKDKNGRKTRDEIPYLHLEQKDGEQKRYEKWHDIFPLKQHQVFMSTIALGGESINLTPAEYCIFLDRSWSPAQNLQAVGRVYRPGQTKAVEVIHIDAVNTVDARVLNNVSQKTGWFHLLFD